MKVNAREAKSIDVCASVCVCLVSVYVCVCVSLALLLPLRVRTTFCYPWLFQPRHTPPKQPPLPRPPSRCHCHCLCCCLGCLCCCTRLRHIDFLRGSHVLGASHGGRQAELSVCIGVRVCASVCVFVCQRRSSTLGAAIFSRPLSPATQCQ